MAIQINSGAKNAVMRNMATMLGGFNTGNQMLEPAGYNMITKVQGTNSFSATNFRETAAAGTGGGGLTSGSYFFGFSKSLQLYSGVMPDSASDIPSNFIYRNSKIKVPTSLVGYESALLYNQIWTPTSETGQTHIVDSTTAIPVQLSSSGTSLRMSLLTAIPFTPTATGTATWWAITIFWNVYNTTYNDFMTSQVNAPMVMIGQISDATSADGTLIVQDTSFVSGTLNSISNLNLTLF